MLRALWIKQYTDFWQSKKIKKEKKEKIIFQAYDIIIMSFNIDKELYQS